MPVETPVASTVFNGGEEQPVEEGIEHNPHSWANLTSVVRKRATTPSFSVVGTYQMERGPRASSLPLTLKSDGRELDRTPYETKVPARKSAPASKSALAKEKVTIQRRKKRLGQAPAATYKYMTRSVFRKTTEEVKKLSTLEMTLSSVRDMSPVNPKLSAMSSISEESGFVSREVTGDN